MPGWNFTSETGLGRCLFALQTRNYSLSRDETVNDALMGHIAIPRGACKSTATNQVVKGKSGKIWAMRTDIIGRGKI